MAIAWLLDFLESSPQGLQRQISFEEQRGRERIAGLAESTRRSLSDQQRCLQEIAGQGMTRIQQTRDEGISKIASTQAAAVQVIAHISPLLASAQAVWLLKGSLSHHGHRQILSDWFPQRYRQSSADHMA